MKIRNLIKKYWFLVGLVLVFAITLADISGLTSEAGRWCKQHYGPSLVIFLVFLFSGMILDPGQIRSGLTNLKGTGHALILIFIISPGIAAILQFFPMNAGVKIGLFLVAVMPTTLSSGVVMTGAAGGRMAHALVITVIANMLAVVTIPVSLSFLLELTGNETAIIIDKSAVMTKIGLFVVLPLLAGLAVRSFLYRWIMKHSTRFQVANQFLILAIVWMGISQSKPVLLQSQTQLILIVLLVLAFHLALLLTAWASIGFFRIPAGQRESILFMGIQKTLPLSVILQVTLFPELGEALLVCVGHHFISLMVDGFMVGRLRPEA